MAKKKHKSPAAPRKMTKRQLSSYQKQRRRQRLVLWGGVGFIVIALLVVGLGWFLGVYQPQHATVLKVNDKNLDYRDYVAALKLYGGSPEGVAEVRDITLDLMQEGELIRQAAAAMGLEVSADEVAKTLEGNGLDQEYAYLMEAMLYQQAVVDEYINPQLPRQAPQKHVYAMSLESDVQANEIIDKIAAGENFTALAARYTLDTATSENDGDMGWHTEEILVGEDYLNSTVVGDYISQAKVGVLSPPLFEEERTKGIGYWLVKTAERDDEKGVHVFGMLLGSEAEAMDVSARLGGGESFADLAAEFSQHNSAEAGGDMGWLTEEQMNPAYRDYVMNADYPLDSPSYPIKDEQAITRGGYWLVLVGESDDDRPVSEGDRAILSRGLYLEWLQELKDSPDNVIELTLTPEQQIQAVGTAVSELTK